MLCGLATRGVARCKTKGLPGLMPAAQAPPPSAQTLRVAEARYCIYETIRWLLLFDPIIGKDVKPFGPDAREWPEIPRDF
jgi:hypothetical protein